jgi:hypothetical protein
MIRRRTKIAHDRLADRGRDGDAEPRARAAGLGEVGGERGVRRRPAAPADERDLGAAAQRVVPTHGEPPSDREALAALLATAGDHVAAVLRGHPLHETMDPLAAAIVGLKGSLH